MDEYVPDILGGTDESGLQDDGTDRAYQAVEAGTAVPSSGFKRHVLKRGIFKAASMQDRLLEK